MTPLNLTLTQRLRFAMLYNSVAIASLQTMIDIAETWKRQSMVAINQESLRNHGETTNQELSSAQ